MNDELKYLLSRTVKGAYSRRAFLGRAGALGVSAAMANTMLATAVRAEGPVKGGTIKMGMQGGESTNSLDPALAASQVPYANLRMLADPLVEVDYQGNLEMRIAEVGGKQRRRKDLDVQNP